jgi:Zinc finger, C3HC4 type (RING finger)
MRKSDRLRSKVLTGPNDIPDDLPAPSTSRPLLPRSRTTSLARSGSQSESGPVSRGSSRSNSSRRSSAMRESMIGVDMTGPGVIVSGLEPVAISSSSLLNMNEDDEAGGPLSTSLQKRKRSDSDTVVQDDNYQTTICGFLFLLTNLLFDMVNPGPSDLSQPIFPSAGSLKGKGKAKESHFRSPETPETITILDTPEQSTSDPKAKHKAGHVESKAKKPKEELLGNYSCPICFSPPTNATLTPCGHICCGPCLFVAVKTTMHRSTMMMAPEGAVAR